MSRRHRDALAVLIGDITSGALTEGDQLPREVDLADNFHISRGVARECVRALEERGLVRVKHGRGATVTPESDWDVLDPDVLAALLSGDHSTEVLTEYLECRRLLDVEAAALAAQRATDAHVTALADALTTMVDAANRTRANPAAEAIYREAELAFHQAVGAAAGNRALGRLATGIRQALAATSPPPTHPKDGFDQILSEHERILTAIADHDPQQARAAMATHLRAIRPTR